MGKKARYSKTLIDLWRIYRKGYAKLRLDPDELYQRMKSDLYQLYPPHQFPDKHSSAIAGFEMWFKDFSQETTHLYFVDRDLKYILREMKLTDLEGIKEYLLSVGEEKDVLIARINTEMTVVSYDFALHIPFEKYGYSFSMTLTEELELVLQLNDGNQTGAIPEDRYYRLYKSSDRDEKYLASVFRLAINTLAYMQCYPELIKDGVPSNIPEENVDRSFQVGLAESLKDSSSDTGRKNTPHFRKAHFRRLKSDYFTNKKGQLVLIQETMVNGKARTVHTASDLSKLETEEKV
ncbi:hypothetical protein [Gracilimonas tropica]|uniref:hypothetical protein n=1 Tax=Gracilimonas tropica TaxID=454600 RepID=UPI00037A77EC|nr:hypothetical protein [Gracilimonas tropica]